MSTIRLTRVALFAAILLLPIALGATGENCTDHGDCKINVWDWCCSGICRDASIDPNNCGTCGNSCNDGNPCTDDVCVLSFCHNQVNILNSCSDGIECTRDACDVFGNCNSSCGIGDICTQLTSKCALGGSINVCIPDQDHPDGCVCVSDGGRKDCNDNDECTEDDCDEATGDCLNIPLDCDDGSQCTEDSCDPASGCLNDPDPFEGDACNDGRLCTLNDLCTDGECKGTPRDCDDSNQCTQDGCLSASGDCRNDPIPLNGEPCDDGNPITSDDTCEDGLCVGVPPDRGECPGGTFPGAGSDTFDTVAEILFDSGLDKEFGFTGPMTIQRSNPDPTTWTIDTEIVELSLTGCSPVTVGTEERIWNIEITIDPNRPSTGQITPIDPTYCDFPAESFFDVFFDIEITDAESGALIASCTNPDAIRLEAEPPIGEIPPLENPYIPADPGPFDLDCTPPLLGGLVIADMQLVPAFPSHAKIKREIIDLGCQLGRTDRSIEDLQGKVDVAESKLDLLETKADIAQTNLSALQLMADATHVMLGALEVKADTAEGKLDILEGKADRAEGKLDALEVKADTAEGKLDALEVKADTVEGKLDALEVKADSAEGKLDVLEVKADRTEGKVDALEVKADRTESKIDTLEGKADAAEGKLDALEGKADLAEGKLDAHEAKLDDINSKIDFSIAFEIKEALHSCRCMPTVFAPDSMGGKLDTAMALVMSEYNLASDTGDPDVAENLEEASCFLELAANLEAAERYNMACKAMATALQLLTEDPNASQGGSTWNPNASDHHCLKRCEMPR